MSISIDRGPSNFIEAPIIVTLRCDAATSQLCLEGESFMHPDGFVGCHVDAMTAGWLERHTPKGRLWLCPRCSGK